MSARCQIQTVPRPKVSQLEERVDRMETALAQIVAAAAVDGLGSWREAFEILERIEDIAKDALRGA